MEGEYAGEVAGGAVDEGGAVPIEAREESGGVKGVTCGGGVSTVDIDLADFVGDGVKFGGVGDGSDVGG